MQKTARNRAEARRRPHLFVVDKQSAQELREQAASSKTRPARRKRGFVLKAVLGLLAGYLVFSFCLNGYQIWQLKKQVKAIQGEQQMLVNQFQEIQQEAKSLENPEVIEKIARESLGMVKAGETIILPAVPGTNIPKPKSAQKEQIND